MSFPFREKTPERKYKGTYKNYRSYKPHLREDFNSRCGYTDCLDMWFGGPGTFHIDHFKPWKKNLGLKEKYDNLVYACSYVNILKSDDEGDYIDPCDVDFNAHFERESDGSIIPKNTSSSAKYMYTRLRLYLSRYRIIWMLERLDMQLIDVRKAIEVTSDGALKKELKDAHYELSNLFHDYVHYLKAAQ